MVGKGYSRAVAASKEDKKSERKERSKAGRERDLRESEVMVVKGGGNTQEIVPGRREIAVSAHQLDDLELLNPRALFIPNT